MVMVMMMMMVNCFYYDKKGDSFDFKTRLATLCQGFALTHSHTLRNCVKFNPIALQKTSRSLQLQSDCILYSVQIVEQVARVDSAVGK